MFARVQASMEHAQTPAAPAAPIAALEALADVAMQASEGVEAFAAVATAAVDAPVAAQAPAAAPEEVAEDVSQFGSAEFTPAQVARMQAGATPAVDAGLQEMGRSTGARVSIDPRSSLVQSRPLAQRPLMSSMQLQQQRRQQAGLMPSPRGRGSGLTSPSSSARQQRARKSGGVLQPEERAAAKVIVDRVRRRTAELHAAKDRGEPVLEFVNKEWTKESVWATDVIDEPMDFVELFEHISEQQARELHKDLFSPDDIAVAWKSKLDPNCTIKVRGVWMSRVWGNLTKMRSRGRKLAAVKGRWQHIPVSSVEHVSYLQ